MEENLNSKTELQHYAELSINRSHKRGHGDNCDTYPIFLSEPHINTSNEVIDEMTNKGWTKRLDIYDNFECWEIIK